MESLLYELKHGFGARSLEIDFYVTPPGEEPSAALAMMH